MTRLSLLVGTLLLLHAQAQYRYRTEKISRPKHTQTEYFRPLACNAGLSMAPCQPWTRVFGTKEVHENPVVIACGTCITMDFEGETLRLNEGIDIQGKLVVPNNVKWNVETTSMVVQGMLSITATAAVTGEPKVKVSVIGNTTTKVKAIENNFHVCGSEGCAVGERAMVVAGGKVNLIGVPPETPTWVHLQDVSSDLKSIVLTESIHPHWGPGSKIVLTSSSRAYYEEQVRTIVRVEPSVAGNVRVEIDQPLAFRPTTLKESADFAVEVALVSRNILFRGLSNAGPNHTGHFMVFKTPLVQQNIDGVEFRHFGQQGTLGRYPIHFHLCGDVSGSIVARNSIHRSQQRCVVVHGTDNLQILENVAYHTAGHCFLTEDGIETGNSFVRNIGIHTVAPKVIIPDNGLNGNETDGEPATFWITNPRNNLIGNVAAGSQMFGFWYEILARGSQASDMDGVKLLEQPMGRFDGNVAHSNFGHGLNFYLNGYEPTTLQKLEHLKVYRNYFRGVRVHRVRNLMFSNCKFADNPTSIVMDRSEEIHFVSSEIIGYSDSYRKFVESRNHKIRHPCFKSEHMRNWELIGISMEPENPWITRLDTAHGGLVLDGVRFSKFEGSGCANPAAFAVGQRGISYGTLEMMSSFYDVQFQESSIDFCTALKDGADDLYLSNLHGLSLDGGQTSLKPGSLVVNSPRMLQFLDQSKCQIHAGKCLAHCEGSCFRTFNFYQPMHGSSQIQLEICLRSQPKNCLTVKGSKFESRKYSPRRYAVHLPAGKYVARFVHPNGETFLDSKANIYYASQEPKCNGGPSIEDIEFVSGQSQIFNKGLGENEVRLIGSHCFRYPKSGECMMKNHTS